MPLLLAFVLGTAAPQGENGQDGIAVLIDVLKQIDDSAAQLDILKGVREGLRGRQNLRMPAGWTEVSVKLSKSGSPEVRSLALSLSTLFGDPNALETLRKTVADPKADAGERQASLDTLLGAHDAKLADLLHGLLGDATIRGAALRALASCGTDRTPGSVLEAYPALSVPEKRDAVNTLVSRLGYARALVDAVQSKRIPRADLTAFTIRVLGSYGDAGIDKWIAEEWGKVRTTPEEKQKEIARYKAMVTADGPAPDPSRGREIFARTCRQCHTFFGDGGKVGPDLTGSNRNDLDYLFSNILDPSAIMGKDYQSSIIKAKGDRLITGIIQKREKESYTVITENDVLIIPRSEIIADKQSEVSMMPEGLILSLTDAQVRDLASYLRSAAQVPLPAMQEGAPQLFNGKDLTGWKGSPEVWSVKDGAIVGKGALKRNEFLFHELEIADFRLIVQAKLIDDKGNSGIQIRSIPWKGHEAKGYQCDMGPGWWGKIYHESGRNRVLYPPKDKEKDFPGEKAVKQGDWNTYEILAVGNRIRTALNGTLCSDLEDKEADPQGDMKGRIAVQVHSGAMTEVHFKEFQLELNPKFEMKTVKENK
jgi:putative heme-binding domain-containing protein